MAVRIYVDQGHNPGNINAGASGNGGVESGGTYWAVSYTPLTLPAKRGV